MLHTRAFRFGYGLLLIFLIIFVAMKIDFIFQPVFLLTQTLFFPFLLSGVLYYLFRPLVNYLQLKNIPRTFSILLIYLLFGLLISLLIFLGGPVLKEQMKSFVDSTPQLMEAIPEKLTELEQSRWFNQLQENDSVDVEKASEAITKSVSSSLSTIGTNFMNIIGVLASIVIVFTTVPFILYYMLKEGEKAPLYILRLLPVRQQKNGRKILADLDEALSSYIQGQVLVSFCIGVMLFIGYLLIDLDYSLLVAIFAMFTNVIPFIGPILAIIPAMIIASIDSPMMVVKVLMVMIVVQQIEGHIISPQVMGKKLEIHPLTIISLLLAAGRIGGVLGLIIAVPVYAVIKVIAHHSYRLWKLRKEKSIEEKIIKGENKDETKSYNDAIF
ncbi:AI-2E family transporter [Neobacillus sp. 179-C4.2 HS]|uniref:AI-2E family transporter n=1 Tax=Neobacillus driksii TaxID=3035913 RepID=A0ABV4YYN7_9BACI|nr:AI-2E family transporter [Neobacillus sp. 179.-C4.2 HS]MDP5194532.1 AI-2E family transporter [Neobacillus sp. 179.-C4.2 HS]